MNWITLAPFILIAVTCQYTIKIEDIAPCIGGLCDIVLNFTTIVQQPSGSIIVKDPFRETETQILLTSATANYTVKYQQEGQIFDSSINEMMNCHCPPSASAPATTHACQNDVWATKPGNPSWEIDIGQQDPNNDCLFAFSPAQCCYTIVPETLQTYDTYSGLTASLEYVSVDYKHREFPLKHGVVSEITDINVTLREFKISAILLDSLMLTLDPNGSPKTVLKSLVNSDGSYDPLKAGWWKQDSDSIRMKFPYRPNVTSTKTSAYKSSLKPITLSSVPPYPSVTLVPEYRKQPGIKLVEADIFWKHVGGAEVSWIYYKTSLNWFYYYDDVKLYSAGDRGIPVTLCIYYPTICACNVPEEVRKQKDPPNSFDIRWCNRWKGFLEAVVRGGATEKIYLDGNFVFSSTRSELKRISYVMPAVDLTVTISSDTKIPPLPLGNCLPIVVEADVVGTQYPAKIYSSKGPCNFIVKDEANVFYVNTSVASLNAILNVNASITIRDQTGRSVIPITNFVPRNAPEREAFPYHFDPSNWLDWAALVLWAASLALLWKLNRYHWAMTLIAIMGLALVGFYSLALLPIVIIIAWKEGVKMSMSNLIDSMKKPIPDKNDPLLSKDMEMMPKERKRSKNDSNAPANNSPSSPVMNQQASPLSPETNRGERTFVNNQEPTAHSGYFPEQPIEQAQSVLFAPNLIPFDQSNPNLKTRYY